MLLNKYKVESCQILYLNKIHPVQLACLVSPGLLRSVSRAVDLIMAHFGSSRDPEEKVFC